MKRILPLNIVGYNFDDLSKEIQEKVLYGHINFWLETRKYNETNKGNFEKAIDKSESMSTPWFASDYIYDYCKDELVKEIKKNNYLFDEQGEIIPIIYYIEQNKVKNIELKITNNVKMKVQLCNI